MSRRALRPEQFGHLLDELSERSGVEFGPGSIRTRSGLMLPASSDFWAHDTGLWREPSGVLGVNVAVRIPDERGVDHNMTLGMVPGSTDPVHFAASTRGQPGTLTNGSPPVSSTSGSDPRGEVEPYAPKGSYPDPIPASSASEALERLRGREIHVTPEIHEQSRIVLRQDAKWQQDKGLTPSEAHLLDTFDDPDGPPQNYALDLSTRGVRRLED